MKELFADIAIPVAVDKLFTYKIPPEMQSSLQPGIRVTVPFGSRTAVGIVTRIKDSTDVGKIRPVKDVIDIKPVIPQDLLDTSRWMAEYYFAPWGEVLKSAQIFSAVKKPNLTVRRRDTTDRPPELSTALSSILSSIPQNRPVQVEHLKKKFKTQNLHNYLKQLEEKNLIIIEETPHRDKMKPKLQTTVEISAEYKERWESWLTGALARMSKREAKQIEIIQSLLRVDETSGEVPLAELLKSAGAAASAVSSLAKKNLIKLGKRESIRAPSYDMYSAALGATGFGLNERQQNALKIFSDSTDAGSYSTFLLHGVTGSGKTQVYIETIKHLLMSGKSAIVLVPEISLTPQIVRRFRYNLGDKVVVMHSRMSNGERFDAWRMAWEGKISVVIGPRSAVFAPLKNLGLIVVDEEHESSYKQYDQTPRYHARDVAIMRATFSGATVILGSATPSVESYSNALAGKYRLVELPDRVDSAQLPEIRIIDIGKERHDKLEERRIRRKEVHKSDPGAKQLQRVKVEFSSMTDLLLEKIKDRLSKKEGTILLQNRRGFAPFVECQECGYVEMCDNCQITLTYHETKKNLRCHYCGMIKRSPIFCPSCNSINIQFRGHGTQRVEEELHKIFPSAAVTRMDLDTTSKKGSHDDILREFGEGRADILLGTQMVAKGLDFPQVTLVGVISADTQMLLPDFRSSERTFQLLTQVAGRAGRSNLKGEVIIQTLQPKHPVLNYVISHDYKGFYDEEIAARRELHYPPFSRIILIEFRGKSEQEVMESAMRFASLIKKQSEHHIMMGPAPAALAKLQNDYRWHLIIKSLRGKDPSGSHAHKMLSAAIRKYREGNQKKTRMVIDVDPAGMM